MHQSIYRNISCINISATYLFRLYHNITPTISCLNAQWILWEFKTFWIMWLSVLFLVSRLINKYRMEYQFGLIQLWIYRMFFIEFFFLWFYFQFLTTYTSRNWVWLWETVFSTILFGTLLGFGPIGTIIFFWFSSFSAVLKGVCLRKSSSLWFLSTDDRGLLLLVVLGFDFCWMDGYYFNWL